ncbi:MAG: CHAT domain-containing protein [Planctomycetes bacterium]|nr:CHAT domain-containing protein [Planctomycetota bacterium]
MLLARLNKGDPQAAADLLPLVYEQLRAIAGAKFRGARVNHTLQPTVLVHEAKRWLKSRTPKQNRDMLAKLGFDAQYRAERGGRKPSQDPQPLADPFDYSHPRYWAAFILIGDPG